MKKFLFFAVICLMVGTTVFAQTKTITGRITGADDNLGVPAAVQIKGTTKGSSANIDGIYSISAEKGQTLIFSSIGYKSHEIIVGDNNVINVQMQPEATQLKESVVTAMGVKKDKKALGYSVQEIKSAELMKNKNTNIINSLSGKIAGVSVTQGGGAAGTGSNIIIRGGTSLERDNQPLFVVDGVIYDNTTVIGGNSGFDGATRNSSTFGNRIMDINPEDIENMSVLKGPAAAALYGSRAGAGAIIITTKKGSEGKVEVNVNSKLTLNKINRFPEQQSKYKRGYYQIDGTLNDYTTQSWGEAFKSGEKTYNNIEDFFRSGAVYDNNVSVSGGSKNETFYLSASRYDQNGIVPNTGFDKTTFRFNGDQKYGMLTVGANVAYSMSHTQKTLTSGGLFDSGGTGSMISTYSWARSENMKHYLNKDGSKYRMFEGKQELEDDVENPYWIINKDKFGDNTQRFTGSINAKLNIFDWFNINYRAGYDTYTTRNNSFLAPMSAVKKTFQNGKMSESDYKYEFISSNLMLNFNKKISDFDFNLMLGNTVEDTKTNTERRDGYDFIIDGFYSFENIAQRNKKFQSLHSRARLIGVYGEFRVDYKNIAYFTFSGRNDWNSTLPKDNRSYFYPAVSGSFVFTELLDKNDIISFGKVRTSWAQVGKGTDPYTTSTMVWPSQTFLGGLGVGNQWQRGNPFLRPEITDSWEIGTELRFLNGRAGLDFSYYYNNSKDQIVVPRLSQATGYILLMTNVGNVTNRGWELSLSGNPVKTRDFSWDMQLNLSQNKGKVKNLLTGQDILYVTDVQVGTVKAASFNNGIFMGISGSSWDLDPNGNTILNKTTGLPTYSTSTTKSVGNREPKLTGGFNNSLTYKNWNLSFLLDFRIGGDIYNGTDYLMTVYGMSKRTQNREKITIKGVINTGTALAPIYDPKTITYEAGKTYNIGGVLTSGESLIKNYWDSYANNSRNFITKTNWLRLRSISLTYTLDQNLLKQIKFINGLSLTASVNNILLLTNYRGLDPETSVAGSGVVGSSSAGIDYCSVPATSSFSFGLNLKF